MTPSTVQTHGNIKHESGFSPYNEVEGIVRGLFLFYMEKFKHIKKTNYVVITGDMITDLGLKGNELLIYALINGFCQDEESQFYGSLAYLMEFTSLSKQGVINILNSLVENGLIEKTQSEINGVKFNSYRTIGGMSNNLTTGQNNDDAKKEKESFSPHTPYYKEKEIEISKERESISKDIPKREENFSPKSLQSPLGEKEKSSAKKKEKPLPFEDEELRKMWEELVKYPDWQRKTDHAIDLRLKTLERLANGDVCYARAIMRQTLEKGWQDFYDVKGYKPAQQPAQQPRKKTAWEEMGMTEEQYRELIRK